MALWNSWYLGTEDSHQFAEWALEDRGLNCWNF